MTPRKIYRNRKEIFKIVHAGKIIWEKARMVGVLISWWIRAKSNAEGSAIPAEGVNIASAASVSGRIETVKSHAAAPSVRKNLSPVQTAAGSASHSAAPDISVDASPQILANGHSSPSEGHLINCGIELTRKANGHASASAPPKVSVWALLRGNARGHASASAAAKVRQAIAAASRAAGHASGAASALIATIARISTNAAGKTSGAAAAAVKHGAHLKVFAEVGESTASGVLARERIALTDDAEITQSGTAPGLLDAEIPVETDAQAVTSPGKYGAVTQVIRSSGTAAGAASEGRPGRLMSGFSVGMAGNALESIFVGFDMRAQIRADADVSGEHSNGATPRIRAALSMEQDAGGQDSPSRTVPGLVTGFRMGKTASGKAAAARSGRIRSGAAMSPYAVGCVSPIREGYFSGRITHRWAAAPEESPERPVVLRGDIFLSSDSIGRAALSRGLSLGTALTMTGSVSAVLIPAPESEWEDPIERGTDLLIRQVYEYKEDGSNLILSFPSEAPWEDPIERGTDLLIRQVCKYTEEANGLIIQ